MSYPTYDQLLPILQASAANWTTAFDVDEENEAAVRSVLAWSCAHPRYQGDPGKGLLLIGHKGSGKTLLLRALSPCLCSDLRFDMVNTRKVTSAYNTEGDKGLVNYTAHRHMAFDDLGDERTGQHYGDKVEVMSLIIQDRYEHFVGGGIMTHFTTNLTPAEIKARYGDRVYSRLRQMVNVVQVGAEVNALDRRETAKAKPRYVRPELPPAPADPQVAASAFARVRDVIAEAKRQFEATGPEPTTPQADLRRQHLDSFTAKLRLQSPEELETARDLCERDGNGAELLALVDAELERRIAAQ